MVALFVNRETDTRALVLNIHFRPETLAPEKLVDAIMVETKLEPDPALMVKKSALLYVNPQTLEQWYEYVDRPPNQEESLADLRSDNALLKVVILCMVPKWSKASVEYERRDIVRLNSGGVYQCLVTHISADAYKPNLFPDYWQQIAQI